MNLFDSHAHLCDSALYGDLEQILERARAIGVARILNICTDPEDLRRGIALAETHAWIGNAGATTPHDVEKEGEAAFEVFAEAARSGVLLAVGETGLDYHYAHSDRAIQQDFLRRYLRLAKEYNLPLVIHCREAFADFFKILDEEGCPRGVLHCFTGTLQEAAQVIERGWYLSLSGIVTFKKSEELRQVAATVPLDQLLIETDAPYLAPQSHRGKRCEPAFVFETATTVAAVRGVAPHLIADATFINAAHLFKKN